MGVDEHRLPSLKHVVCCCMFLTAEFASLESVYSQINELCRFREEFETSLKERNPQVPSNCALFEFIGPHPSFSIRLLNFAARENGMQSEELRKRIRTIINRSIDDGLYRAVKHQFVAWDAEVDRYDILSQQAAFAPLTIDTTRFCRNIDDLEDGERYTQLAEADCIRRLLDASGEP